MRNAQSRTIGDVLYNFHWVVPGEVARAMQAWAGGLKPFLKKRGIRAIINLRGRNDDLNWWKKGDRRRRTSSGIAHLDAMLDSRKLPTRAMLVTLIESFDTAPRPISAQMLRRPGPHQLCGCAISDSSRWLGRDGCGAGPVRPLSLSAFPQDPAALAETVSGLCAPGQRWRATGPMDRRKAIRRKSSRPGWTPKGMQGSYAAIFTKPTRSPRQW